MRTTPRLALFVIAGGLLAPQSSFAQSATAPAKPGVVSHVNQTAIHLGLQVGSPLQPQLLTHQSSIFALCGNDVNTKRTKP